MNIYRFLKCAFVASVTLGAWCGGVIAADLSELDLKEIRRVEASLADGTLLEPPGWTVNHCASDEGLKELEKLGYPRDNENLEAVVRKAGGWEKYKANAAELLKSEDVIIRGFIAIWLADLGDRQYAKDLLVLAQKEHGPNSENPFRSYDRRQALMAIGVLHAREHIKYLVECLNDADDQIRSGAAVGLGWMPAAEHHGKIAALLDDGRDEVAESAIWSLAKMQAKQYADRFSAIASDPEENFEKRRAALAGLAALGAKEQAPKIVKLLEDVEISQEVIRTLALMDCRECVKEIAGLLGSTDRNSALVALGIMRATQYAPKIAKYLDTKDRALKQAASWSLIMMESKDHAAAAVAAHNPFELDQAGLPYSRRDEVQRQLNKRFETSLARMKAEVKQKER